jgi:hypothetical protein
MGADKADCRVPAFPIAEELDVVKHISSRLVSGPVLPACALGLEPPEEPLLSGVVPDVAQTPDRHHQRFRDELCRKRCSHQLASRGARESHTASLRWSDMRGLRTGW